MTRVPDSFTMSAYRFPKPSNTRAFVPFPGQNYLIIFRTSMSSSPTILRIRMRKQSQPYRLTNMLCKFLPLKTEESSNSIKTIKNMAMSVIHIRSPSLGESINISTYLKKQLRNDRTSTSDPDAPAEAAPGRRGSAPGDPAQPGG